MWEKKLPIGVWFLYHYHHHYHKHYHFYCHHHLYHHCHHHTTAAIAVTLQLATPIAKSIFLTISIFTIIPFTTVPCMTHLYERYFPENSPISMSPLFQRHLSSWSQRNTWLPLLHRTPRCSPYPETWQYVWCPLSGPGGKKRSICYFVLVSKDCYLPVKVTYTLVF